MTGHIGVHSVESLKQFKAAMVRFQGDATAALEQAEGVIRETIAHCKRRGDADRTKCGRARTRLRTPDRNCMTANRLEMTTSAPIAGNSSAHCGKPSASCRRPDTNCILLRDRSAHRAGRVALSTGIAQTPPTTDSRVG